MSRKTWIFFNNEGVNTLEQVVQKEVNAPPLETLKAKVDRALRVNEKLKMALLIAGWLD